MSAPEIPEITKEELPDVTLKNLMSVASAVVCGKKVSHDRMRERMKICLACDKVRTDNKTFRCGICGCRLNAPASVDTRYKGWLVNLVLYEETAEYGCKHSGGSSWKRGGV